MNLRWDIGVESSSYPMLILYLYQVLSLVMQVNQDQKTVKLMKRLMVDTILSGFLVSSMSREKGKSFHRVRRVR